MTFYLFTRFKIKYHPEESVKRKEEQLVALKVSNLRFIFPLGLLVVTVFLNEANCA